MAQHKDKLFEYSPGNPEPKLVSERVDGKWDPVAPWELPGAPVGGESTES